MINYQYKYRTNFRQLKKKKWMRPGLKTKANSLHFLQKTKRRPMSFHLQSDPYLTWHIECQNTKSQRKHFKPTSKQEAASILYTSSGEKRQTAG